jgi:aspartate kinase
MTDAPVRPRTAPIVLKIGGSVLTGPKAYARTAKWLQQSCEGLLGLGAPVVVVVSAESGVTDRLLADAQAICPAPDARALDLLWSTGELRSAALLALHLQARGVPARALNVHEAGLRTGGAALGVRTEHLTRALEAHAVVIVPGFLATEAGGAIVSLGRGGSDLSAVALAAAVGAERCELIKDVPGYFTADPAADAGARHIPFIDFETALEMAAGGCDLVQAAALEAARACGVRLVIRTTDAAGRRTIVSPSEGESHAFRHEDHSRRAAIGA